MVSDSSALRPTKSVVRKALCDILRPVLKDLVLVDFFAGTGQVSFDLLENGARAAYAVDERPEPENLPEQVSWYQQSVESFLLHGPPEPVGLVFLDPPYGSGRVCSLLPRLHRANWLQPAAIIAAETHEDTILTDGDDFPETLELKRNRRYGGSRLWIFQEPDVPTENDYS